MTVSARLNPRNPVALVAAALGVFALVGLPFLSPGWLLFKANRLVQGDVYTPFAVSITWTASLLLCWGLLAGVGLWRTSWRPYLVAGLGSLALILTLLFVADGTNTLLAEAANSARVSLRGGVWLTLLAYYIALYGALNEVKGGLWRRLLIVAPGLLIALSLLATGSLSNLGLSRELASQGSDFRAELVRHLALSSSSVLLATLIGLPAAIWAARREQVAAIVLPTVSLLQTLPSLALFGLMLAPLAQLGRNVTVAQAFLIICLGLLPALGLGLLIAMRGSHLGRWQSPLGVLMMLLALIPLSLLMIIAAVMLNEVFVAILSFDFDNLELSPGWSAPLSSLGVRGIGSAPALIALTLYALLPIVRNAYTGIVEVPKAATEAGRGMGMSPGQILRRVELPLALPLIVEGLRASTVLTIGITTVAYLIGAGGLGTFIQRGIDQVVPDLILLGAIPIIMLALLADGLLRGLGLVLTPRGIRGEL